MIVHFSPDLLARESEFVVLTVEFSETRFGKFAVPVLNWHLITRHADAVPEVLNEIKTLRRGKLFKLFHCWVHVILQATSIQHMFWRTRCPLLGQNKQYLLDGT